MSTHLLKRQLLKNGQDIDIQQRTNPGATFGQVNVDEQFTTIYPAVRALVQTPKGKATFDDVGLDTAPTHRFVLLWLDNLSSENWIFFKNKQYRILTDLNCCEKDEVLTLYSVLRGQGEAAKA